MTFWAIYLAISGVFGLAMAIMFVQDETAMKGESPPTVVALFFAMWILAGIAWPVFLFWLICAFVLALVKRLFGPLPPKEQR